MLFRSGHDRVVELLLARQDINVNAAFNDITALFIAAQNGHDRVVELLLARQDINVNAAFNDITVLHVAAHNGHAQVVELLLAKGVDPNHAYQITKDKLRGLLKEHHFAEEKIETFISRKSTSYFSSTLSIRPAEIAFLMGHTLVLDKFKNLYNTEEKCLNEFYMLHFKKCADAFFTSSIKSGLKGNENLAEIIKHALLKNNRSRQVFVELGWMDLEGNLTEIAPQPMVDNYPKKQTTLSQSRIS